MISIRYSSELQPGLNGKAVRIGGTTFVYLLPGLTSAQRAATLRRLRQHGRMGLSPRLPAVPLLAAVLQDRIRTAFGQGRAIVRTHPAGSTVPVIIISAAVIGFLLVSAVSIKIIHTPLATGATHASAPAPGAGTTPRQGQGTGSPAQMSPSRNGPSAPGTPTGSTGDDGAVPKPTSSAGTSLSSSAATSPPSAQPTTPTTSAMPASSATPMPSPSASPLPRQTPPAVAGTTVCVRLGPFGICV